MRLTVLVFLSVLPFALVPALGMAIIPIAFLSNIIYFSTEPCSEQMEYPFGDDHFDVDCQKIVRRIDKHLAAMCAIAFGTRLSPTSPPEDTPHSPPKAPKHTPRPP